METVVLKLFVDKEPMTYITGLYGEKEGCYLRLFEVLDHLEYKYEADWAAHRFTGYLPVEGKSYCISEDTLTYFGQKGVVSTEIKWNEEHDLFSSIRFLEELYVIKIELNIGELAVKIESDESASYRKNRIRSRQLAEFLAQKENAILKNVEVLEQGMLKVNALGYSVMSVMNFDSKTASNWNVRGTLYGELLRGAYALDYNYATHRLRDSWSDNLRFNWEKIDVASKWIKTILIDHDYPSLTKSVGRYASSITLSNSKAKSYLDRAYMYEGKTQPNAEVEIYNNGQLVDYIFADSLGRFSVEVPVTNVENKITAVSYNSYGAPIASEKMIFMPAGLQQRRQFIYKFVAGITDLGEFFVAPTLEYGLTSRLTLQAGSEMVAGRGKPTAILLLGSKIALNKGLRLDFKYIPAVVFSARFYGNITSSVNANISYERYNKGQKVISSQLRDVLQFQMGGGLPKFIKGNYNLGLYYFKYGHISTLSTYAGINIWRKNFLGSFYLNTTEKKIQLKSSSYTFKLGNYFSRKWYNEMTSRYWGGQKSFSLQDRVNYQFKNRLTAFSEVSYYFKQKQFYVNAGVVLQFPFMRNRTGFTVASKNSSAYTEFSGSVLVHDLKNINFSERYTSGATLKVILFVDRNANGKYDKGETLIEKPEVLIRTYAIENKLSDGVIYTDIPANVPFKLIVPQQKFKDISWQLSDYEVNLKLSPYQTKTIYVPVKVLTEVMGEVYFIKRGEKIGIPNIVVVVTHTETGKKTTLYSDDFGTFIHAGLTCGQYTIDLNPQSLKRRKFEKTNSECQYTIDVHPAEEGGQLEGFDFELTPES